MKLEEARLVAARFAEAQGAKQLVIESTAVAGEYFVWPGRLALDSLRWKLIETVRPKEKE